MSTVSLAELKPYQSLPETQAKLPFADLITLDLSQFDLPGGKEALARQLHDAIRTVGFFYLTNFGLSDEEVEKQFDLAIDIFSLSLEEKLKYPVTNELKGGPLGYKPKGVRKGAHGLMDNTEIYDDPKYIDFFETRGRPDPVKQSRAETERFCRHIHEHMLKRLLILVAIIMELEDEEALWKIHDYSKVSNCHMRYMLQHPRTPEEIEVLRERGSEEVIYGHTDFGTFTFLFRQPIAGLQVRLEVEKEWRWVKPVQGACVVNVADTLSFLTGGYLKSSIHRVVLPPEDQRCFPRVGVIYFSRPEEETRLKPVDSPVIQRVGDRSIMPPNNAVTVAEWVQARYANIPANYARGTGGGDKTSLVKNVEVKTYA